MSLIGPYALEEVIHQPRGSLRNDGTWDHSDVEVTVKARVTDTKRTIFTQHGIEEINDRAFWVDPDVEIALGDRLKWNNQRHNVTNVYVGKALDGTATHKKVTVEILSA